MDIVTYLNNYKIKGWLNPGLFNTVVPLIKKIGMGPVAEIGVYHGKFLFALGLLNPNKKLKLSPLILYLKWCFLALINSLC